MVEDAAQWLYCLPQSFQSEPTELLPGLARVEDDAEWLVTWGQRQGQVSDSCSGAGTGQVSDC
jgi:hypothetical protein